MEDDGWLALAYVDTTVVAEMLMRLRYPQAETPRVLQAAAALPGRWGVVRKRPRTAVKLGGWCYSEAAKREEAASPEQQKVDGKETAGSPMTPLSWSAGVGSGGDGSDSSCDRKIEAERTVQVSVASGSGGGGGGRLKAAAREANASRLLSKRTAKRKALTVLKEEENQLLSDKASLEKEMKVLMANYMVAVNQNKRLKILQEGLQTMSSPTPVTVAPDVVVKEAGPAPLRPCDVSEHVIVPALRPCSASLSFCEEAFMIPDLNLPLDDTVAGLVA